MDWISTILFQIPMNVQLGKGKDLALIQQVMDTNWGRVFLETLQVVLAFRIMQKRADLIYYARNSAPAIEVHA
jgi:hypothetical protein